MDNIADEQYLNLLEHVLSRGRKKTDRTGIGTYSVFGHMMRFDMLKRRFPLLTTKKIYTKAVVHELLMFLKGGDNIKYLVDNGVNIWNEWPWQRYCAAMRKSNASEPTLDEFVDRIRTDEQFAATWGRLGPVYGKQWVRWTGVTEDGRTIDVNQIDGILDDLRNNPDSRRIMVNAWNVSQIPDMVLPPCHWAFQLWTRELTDDERRDVGKSINRLPDQCDEGESIERSPDEYDEWTHESYDQVGLPRRAVSLMFHMRSVDCFLGMPFDIASYGLLLSMIAQSVGMVPDELVITTGDTHIYLNHVDQVKEQLGRTMFDSPKLWLEPSVSSMYDFKYEDIHFINYKAHPSIKAPVAV